MATSARIEKIAASCRVPPAFVERIADVISDLYQGCGHDIWGDETPDDNEYVDVMFDLVAQREGDSNGLTPNEYAAWHAMPDYARRQVAMLVGP
jgi:hypothetical protein